jgi:anaerobic C4-dicarboxylate transporter
MDEQQTDIKHSILMQTKGTDTFLWLFVIRWLHDALIEDAFDKVENQFSEKKKKTPWNQWVKFLRSIFKKRKSSKVK